MTNLEALEILSIDEDMQKKLPNLKEVYAVAVKAIKKQIPQKPVYPDEDYGTFKCPACGGLIYTEDRLETHRFCLLCGQALDWNE